jgi:hypothetical protein
MYLIYNTLDRYVLEELSMPLFEKRDPPPIKRVDLPDSLTENIKCMAVYQDSLAICYKGHYIIGNLADFFQEDNQLMRSPIEISNIYEEGKECELSSCPATEWKEMYCNFNQAGELFIVVISDNNCVLYLTKTEG